MAQRTLDTTALEQAQAAAAQAETLATSELAKLRKKISKKKGALTPFEYALLFEDDLASAKEGAKRIETFIEHLSEDVPVLLARKGEKPNAEKIVLYLLAILTPESFLLSREWTAQSKGFCSWSAAGIVPHCGAYFMTEDHSKNLTKIPDWREMSRLAPLHRLLEAGASNPDGAELILVGESAILKRFVETGSTRQEKRLGFAFLVSKYRAMGFEARLGLHHKRLEKEREDTIRRAEQLVKELKDIYRELFFSGSARLGGNGKNDGTAWFFSRARRFYEQLRTLLEQAELFGAKSEDLHKLEALEREWMPFGDVLRKARTPSEDSRDASA